MGSYTRSTWHHLFERSTLPIRSCFLVQWHSVDQ